MECNFTTINNDKALRDKIKKEKRINTILTISFLLSFLSGAALFFMGMYLNALFFIGTGVLWMGSGAIYAIQVTLKENHYSPTHRYFTYTENAEVISAELIIENTSVNRKDAIVKLVVENADHTISHHSVTFPVIEKTNVTENTLDLLEEKVYVPYVNNNK